MLYAFARTPGFACALCLLIAVAAGAYRQWCLRLWERIELLPTADDRDYKSEDARLGAYVPGWKSNNFRVGSWFLVTACSTFGAAWGTILLRATGIVHAGLYFLGILLTRWALSATLGLGAANLALRKYATETPATGYKLQSAGTKTGERVEGTRHRL